MGWKSASSGNTKKAGIPPFGEGLRFTKIMKVMHKVNGNLSMADWKHVLKHIKKVLYTIRTYCYRSYGSQ